MPEIKTSSPLDYTETPQNLNPQPESENQPFTEPQNEDKPSKSSSIRNLISTVVLFLAAPLLALFLIVFVIQSYEVDGPSMQETLQNKDLLIVNKIDRTLSRITRDDYIPPRYQIIIFSRDESGGLGGDNVRQLVKRVIALPGERVVVENGKVTVFNQQHPEGFDPDKDQEYSKTINSTPGNVNSITLKQGEIFVLGDNRNNSLDSRYFGAVEAKDIVGKLGLRIFPLNKARSF